MIFLVIVVIALIAISLGWAGLRLVLAVVCLAIAALAAWAIVILAQGSDTWVAAFLFAGLVLVFYRAFQRFSK